MKMSRERIVRYLVGITAILIAILLTGFYYIFLYAYADGPPPNIVRVLLGIAIGTPLFTTGITVIFKQYRVAIYTALSTGIIYVMIPLCFDSYFSTT